MIDTPPAPRSSASTSSWWRARSAAVATLAVMVAIYAATTVRDPMAKRVKALNERREQLKAGIVASTSQAARRASSNRNEIADKIREPAVVAEGAPGRARSRRRSTS